MDEIVRTPLERTLFVKHYLINFSYKDGNGWAVVNANSVKQASDIFKAQTKYEQPKVLNVKELKYFGEETQLVYEGAVIGTNTDSINIDLSGLEQRLIEYIKEYVDYYISQYGGGNEDPSVLLNYLLKSDFNTYFNNNVDSELNAESIRPVSNAVVTETFNNKQNKLIAGGGVSLVPQQNGNVKISVSPGASGVGIQSINVLQSNIDGGNNVVTITLTNGQQTTFNIKNGKSGTPAYSISESIGAGTFTQAQAEANSNKTTYFGWILEDTFNGIDIRKLIWHVPGTGANNDPGYFIDALGAVIE